MTAHTTLSAWNEFVTHEKILPEVSPLVGNSWRRCWARMNPTQKLQLNKLNIDTMLAAQVASFDLISIARPIMEDIFQSIDQANTAIVLTNGTGYVLDMLAEGKMQTWLDSLGISTGVLFTEGHVGTNALGLALTERMPLAIVGYEHYARQLHHMAGAAAPIFDITGRPLGVLGLLSPVSSYQSQSLGLVVAGAKGIEAQRQADLLLAEQNSQLAQLNVILDTISEGIVVWNGQRVLMHINNFAARLIDRPIQSMVGQPITSLISYPPFIHEALDRRKPLTDVEATLKIGDKTLSCILSLRFVMNKDELKWIIITLRPVTDVRELVQRQVGAQAVLRLEDIPGDSPQMRRVHNFVKSTAPAKASILIKGESGTGKNVLAHAIHNESPRREGPFLIFACGSVPNELVMNELLGHEEGVFAKRPGSRPSKFELAQGGTIFFQDVDTLPLEAQAVLLNVLELGVIQRLGSDRVLPVDVRIIASTSADMDRLIAKHQFRADLYYRLSTFAIELPALRERPRDIPIMAERIVNRLARQLNRPLTLGPGVLDLLKRYPWPGNIRELESALGTAVSQIGFSNLIEVSSLPAAIRSPRRVQPGEADEGPIHSMEEVERETILQTAQACAGNLSQMALVLGLGRTTLWRKVKKHHIMLEDYRRRGEEVAA